jgi:hypothetical protein
VVFIVRRERQPVHPVGPRTRTGSHCRHDDSSHAGIRNNRRVLASRARGHHGTASSWQCSSTHLPTRDRRVPLPPRIRRPILFATRTCWGDRKRRGSCAPRAAIGSRCIGSRAQPVCPSTCTPRSASLMTPEPASGPATRTAAPGHTTANSVVPWWTSLIRMAPTSHRPGRSRCASGRPASIWTGISGHRAPDQPGQAVRSPRPNRNPARRLASAPPAGAKTSRPPAHVHPATPTPISKMIYDQDGRTRRTRRAGQF